MKSDLASNKIVLDELTVRIRAYIRLRINRGEFTERSLARILRISQPHLHNVLKGVRRVQMDFANRVMIKFDLTIFDLITQEEIWNYLDETNPDWLLIAARRKRPLMTTTRQSSEPDEFRASRSGL